MKTGVDVAVPPRLVKLGDGLGAIPTGATDPVPGRLVYARPLTGRGKDIVCLNAKGEEIGFWPNLAAMDPASQALAEVALRERYFLPRITRIRAMRSVFGDRYFDVDTNRGPRSFALRNPNRNVVPINEEYLVIKDSMGNRYEVGPLSDLDTSSRMRLALIL